MLSSRSKKNMTYQQKTMLISNVEVDPYIFTFRGGTLEGRRMYKSKWQRMTTLLNSVPGGARKSIYGWQKAFTHMKTKIKAKATAVNNGTIAIESLNDVEARVVALMRMLPKLERKLKKEKVPELEPVQEPEMVFVEAGTSAIDNKDFIEITEDEESSDCDISPIPGTYELGFDDYDETYETRPPPPIIHKKMFVRNNSFTNRSFVPIQSAPNKPVTARPVPIKTVTIRPVPNKPVTLQPVPNKPATIQSVPNKPVTTQHVANKPAAIQSVSNKTVIIHSAPLKQDVLLERHTLALERQTMALEDICQTLKSWTPVIQQVAKWTPMLEELAATRSRDAW